MNPLLGPLLNPWFELKPKFVSLFSPLNGLYPPISIVAQDGVQGFQQDGVQDGMHGFQQDGGQGVQHGGSQVGGQGVQQGFSH